MWRYTSKSWFVSIRLLGTKVQITMRCKQVSNLLCSHIYFLLCTVLYSFQMLHSLVTWNTWNCPHLKRALASICCRLLLPKTWQATGFVQHFSVGRCQTLCRNNTKIDLTELNMTLHAYPGFIDGKHFLVY